MGTGERLVSSFKHHTAHHLQHAGKSSQPPTSKTELTKQTQNDVLEAQGVFSKCFPPTFLST